MRVCVYAILLLTVAWTVNVAGQDDGAGEFNLQADDVTVVTSDRLTYDAKEQYALFENNVVVTDPQLQLTADKLILRFDENGEARLIEAEGHVHITQDDKKSISGTAKYEVATGKIVLGVNPRVTRGKDVLQGETITFWRDHNKLVCEPQARLIIYPQKGGARAQLFGD